MVLPVRNSMAPDEVDDRRWVVQAAPTGFTAIVDADGNVLQRTAVSEQRVLLATVELRDGFTWYTNLGDGPFIVALLTMFGVSLWFSRRREFSRHRASA